ncbi:MAG: hypothetical protein V7750_11925 [Sneathiella sp.]
MLDTAFPRPLGDAGNTDSYDCPARLKIVKDAGSLEIVKNGRPTDELVENFCTAAQELEAEGAGAIVSTCGFLMTIQEQIAGAVTIPVMVSSLSLHPVIRAVMGEGKIGILTASKNALGATVLGTAKIRPTDVAIKGLEDCLAFSEAILTEKKNQRSTMDVETIEQAVLQKASELVSENPGLTAILLECGNLPPYAAAIEKSTGLPVFSILDGARLIWRKNE